MWKNVCSLTIGTRSAEFQKKRGIMSPLEFSVVLWAFHFPFALLLIACHLQPCMIQGAFWVRQQPFPFESIRLNYLIIHEKTPVRGFSVHFTNWTDKDQNLLVSNRQTLDLESSCTYGTDQCDPFWIACKMWSNVLEIWWCLSWGLCWLDFYSMA